MPKHIDEDALCLDVSEDLLSAESLDPLGVSGTFVLVLLFS